MNNIDLQSIKRNFQIVGRDMALDTALNTILQVAPTDLSVLIQGESGVGKEVLPRILHSYSPRKNKKYIAINCGSIPEGTIDSELFGHRMGSFTGATEDREGFFGAANGGTLFLDEVGELPLSTQARLLRVLETGEYIRVGDNEPRKTDVRIVAATNVDIPSAIRDGRFREDLYYRLSTIFVKMPPLRERGIDAVLLFRMFAKETAEKYKIPNPIRLTPEAEEVMQSYKWPGNIRQLKNITEQMSFLCRDTAITPEILREHGIVPNIGESTSMARLDSGKHEQHDYKSEMEFLMQVVMNLKQEVESLKEEIHGTSTPSTTSTALTTSSHALRPLPQKEIPRVVTIDQSAPANQRFSDADAVDIEILEEEREGNPTTLREMERREIEKALMRNRYNRKNAALELGISDRTLYRKMEEYGINKK